jgi:hypothetical protein
MLMNPYKEKVMFSLVASLLLGLAPFLPEPHIVGKIRWVLGGAKGMQAMDYLDLLYHSVPWLFLIYYCYKFLTYKDNIS